VQRQQEQITEDRNYFNIKIKSLENKIDALIKAGENPKEE